MVRITLTNENKSSTYKTATLDLTHNIVLLDQQHISIPEFKQLDFYHPLLVEPPLELKNDCYTYAYQDLNQLLLAPRRVYATLLNSLNGKECIFKIIPAPEFEQLKADYEIPFSLNYRTYAQETINVDQLNKIVSEVWKKKFQLRDKLILNAHFSSQELPEEINGDALYTHETLIRQLLNEEEHFEQYELRYINRVIGFGLFTRQEIKKGTCVTLYLGVKTREAAQNAYFFINKKDSLNMGTDSHEYGNMSRFINHAPDGEQGLTLCPANLSSLNSNVFGMEIVAYWASRDIKKGEQLLVNYGSEYFGQKHVLCFKLNGIAVAPKGNKLVDNFSQKMSILQISAHNGVKDAKFKLIKHYFIVTLLIIIFFIAVHFI